MIIMQFQFERVLTNTFYDDDDIITSIVSLWHYLRTWYKLLHKFSVEKESLMQSLRSFSSGLLPISINVSQTLWNEEKHWNTRISFEAKASKRIQINKRSSLYKRCRCLLDTSISFHLEKKPVWKYYTQRTTKERRKDITSPFWLVHRTLFNSA